MANEFIARKGLIISGSTISTDAITSQQTISGSTVNASGNIVAGTQLVSNLSSGDEGGEIILAKPQTNTTLAGTGITIDVYQNKLRIFEQGGTARGGYWDITSLAAGASTNLGAGTGTVTSIVAGNGLTGGTISTTGTITVDTGSSHFTTGSLFVLNNKGVISSSQQVSYNGLSNIPSGILSSSTQFNTLTGTSASFATIANNLNGGATNYIPLWTSTTAQSSSNIYQSSSNVGIGTTNPANKLQIGSVGSSGYGGNDLVIGNGTEVMAFYQYSSGPSAWFTNTNFSLMPSGVGSTGNLGVGTTTPSAKLHVQGTISSSGNVAIGGNLTVNGLLSAVSTSIQYVTSSQLNVADNRIIVNTNDLVRFGGLSIIDSGSSSPATASIYWDSLNHHFIYENISGAPYNSAMFIAGPTNTSTLGNEVGLTTNRVPVAVGTDHIDSRLSSSSIRVDFPSRFTHIEAGLHVTGSITSSVGFNGSGTGITGLTNANLSGTAGITNANLANSTISGVALGSNLNTLTISSPLSGTGYNGSAAVTIALASGYGDTQNPFASKTANHFLAAPNGSAGAPTFRAIVAADIPTLNQNTTGTAASASIVTGTTGQILRHDDRIIEPSAITAGYLQFGFTSWANNNTSPYADFLHMRSYTDSSGGNDNLLLFRKDAIGIRLYQQTFGSGTAYSTYKDVAFTDSNITGTAAAWTTARTITIGSTGKSVDGSGNVSWTLAEIGAYSSANPSGYTSNTGTVTSVTVSAGTGMSGGGTVTTSGTITLTNAGVTSVAAGTGISVSAGTGSVTITNSGVTSVNGGTGAVTVAATNQTMYIGTTATTINRGSAQQTLTGITIMDNGATRIVNPDGAAYVTSTSTVTGAWKIKLPVAKNNSSTMLRMTVQIYQYSTGTSHTFLIGGYNYAGGGWYNVFATNITDVGGNYNVRFGADATSDCIWIGETNSSWAYPQVFVTDFQMGYSAYDSSWATGWSITPVTSFDTVETTRSAGYVWNNNNDGAGSGLDADLLDGYNSATTATANTIALRDGSGHLSMNYGFASYYNSSDDVSAGTITYIMAKFGDNYYRSATAAKVAAFISGQTMNISGTATNITAYTIDQNLGTSSTPTFARVTVSGTTGDVYTMYSNTGGQLYVGKDNSAGSLFNTNSAYANVLYTSGTQPLIFLMNGSEAMRLTSGLRLGIGTTSPTQTLDVNGPVALSGKEAFISSDAYLRINQGLAFSAGIWMGTSNLLAGTTYWGVGSNGGTTSSRVYIYGGTYNGTNVIYLDGSNGNAYFAGSVGINTTSPNGRLDVVSGTNSARILYVKGPSYGVRIGADGTGGFVEGVDASNGVTSYQPLYVGGSTVYIQSSGTTKVTVTSSGAEITSLGVGTAPSNTTGEIRATNNVTAYYSDARLKKFLGPIKNALHKVQQLTGYYFIENEVAKSLGYNNDDIQVGVSAQEVQSVLPEVVTTAPISDEYLTVRYEKMVPLLIQAIKEQQEQIEELKFQLGMK